MKKTSNKGFSMVELIIVIAIMAILAAALAPALIKYINKSRLSTDIQTGTSIASAASAAMAVESANDASTKYTASPVVVNPTNITGDSFASEFWNVMGVSSVAGKAKKDIGGTTIPTNMFYMQIGNNDAIQVWYGTPDSAHLVSPNPGSVLAEY